MKKIISVLLLTMYAVTNFAFTVSAAGAGGSAGAGGGSTSAPSTDISIYTENLFGDAYYNCDTVTEGVGVQGNSGGDAFDESVETGTDAYDTASIKLTGRHRNLFEKTVAGDDLLGKSVKVSLKLKVSEAAYSGVSTKPVRFYYRVQYNDGTTDGQIAASYLETTNLVSTSWADYSITFDIPADGGLTGTQTCTDISFYARIGNNLSGAQGETSAWVDCISLYALPNETELTTTVESIVPVDVDGKTESVELTLNTTYVNIAGFDAASVTLNDNDLTMDTDYYVSIIPAAEDKSKVIITFDIPKYIMNFTVSGIKDLWGRAIDETNAELDFDREHTSVTSANGIEGTDGNYTGVELLLNTRYVEDLSTMSAILDGDSFEEYTSRVDVVDSTTSKIVITFNNPQSFETFAVSGIKDSWGRNVDTSAAIITNYTLASYTTNLLGDAFTNCDTSEDVTATMASGSSGYTRELDTTTSYSGAGSIKITGSSGASPNAIYGYTAMSKSESPSKVMASAFIKKSSDLVMTVGGKHPVNTDRNVTGENADTSPTFTRVRFYVEAKYLLPGNSEESKITINKETIIVNIDTENNDWQCVSKLIELDYSLIPSNATMTKLELVMRLDNGRGSTNIEQGSIWIDEIKMLRVPDVGTYPVSYIGSEPSDGNTNGETDKVVFKFSGPVHTGSVSKGIVTINGEETKVSFSGTYDNLENITRLVISPVGGFNNDTAYTVSITGITDAWGEAIIGTFSTSFTTIKKYDITSSFVKVAGGVEGATLTHPENGDIKAKFDITNNTQSDMNVILILAECNGDTIEKFALSPQYTNVASGLTQSLEATITGFTVGEGKYLKAFLWNTVDGHLIMSPIKKLE